MGKKYNTREVASKLLSAIPEHQTPAYTLGFEFEMPYRSDGRVTSTDDRELLKEAGFPYGHPDGGGWEVGSPVCSSIYTARGLANNLIEAARKSSTYDIDEGVGRYAGIHVHTMINSPKFLYKNRLFTILECEELESRYQQGEPYQKALMDIHRRAQPGYVNSAILFQLMGLVLNRGENREFLSSFSKRNIAGSPDNYRNQCVPVGWDTTSQVSALSKGINHGMIRQNIPRREGTNTIENRMWKGLSCRLIPAIEWSHGFIRWSHAEFNKLSKEEKESLLSAFWTTKDLRGEWNEFVPRLTDFFDWVNNSKGYHVLKGEIKCHT